MKVLAIVPARCGSKGFPHKNIAKIGDKTLLELAVNVAAQCNVIDDVYISTDCEMYEQMALKAGAKSLGLRPEHLATDTAKSIDAIIDILEKVNKKYDYVVLLQPSSPLRTPQDIEDMINSMLKENVDASVSVVQLDEPHPYKLKSINEDGYITSFIEGTISEVPRQLLPKVYALNGALYITKTEIILNQKTLLPKNTIPYIMNKLINIDTEEDFLFMKTMYEIGKIKLFGVENANNR